MPSAALRVSNDFHKKLTRFRRRVWFAIGLYLVTRAGDAALHALAPPISDPLEINP
jgi:hypothetical protein